MDTLIEFIVAVAVAGLTLTVVLGSLAAVLFKVVRDQRRNEQAYRTRLAAYRHQVARSEARS